VGRGDDDREQSTEEGFWRASILTSLNKSLETRADVK